MEKFDRYGKVKATLVNSSLRLALSGDLLSGKDAIHKKAGFFGSVYVAKPSSFPLFGSLGILVKIMFRGYGQ